MCTLTLVVALAVPVNVGAVLLEGVGGCFSVTVGELVSTMNVTGVLTPVGFPGSELSWVATAVYCPLGRAGLAGPEVQAPPVRVAAAVETIGPSALPPE